MRAGRSLLLHRGAIRKPGRLAAGPREPGTRRSEEPRAHTSNSGTTDHCCPRGFSEDSSAKGSAGRGVATKVGWRIRWEGARQVAGQPGCLVHPVGGCTCARETEALGWAISLDVTCFSPWEEGWVLMDLWRPDSRCLSCPPRVPSCTTFLWFPCNGCGQVTHSVQQQVGEATCVSFRLAQSCLRSLFP